MVSLRGQEQRWKGWFARSFGLFCQRRILFVKIGLHPENRLPPFSPDKGPGAYQSGAPKNYKELRLFPTRGYLWTVPFVVLSIGIMCARNSQGGSMTTVCGLP
jgi:hypothetical protein